jgi:type I restriction enzyme S subunit
MTPIKRVPLAEALRTAPVFVDGDWIESKDQDPDGDVRLIQLADIGIGSFINKSRRFLTEDTARRLGCTFLESGDVLIARMPDPIGRACVFPGIGQPAVTAVDVCIVRANPEVIESIYLVHFLNSADALRQISSKASGSTRQRISRSNLGTIEIPLPPLEEQRRIAAILDKATALEDLSAKQSRLLEEAEKHLFLECFGSPFPGKTLWPVAQLGELGSLERGISKHRPRNDPSLMDGPYPFIQTGDVAGCGGKITTFSATYSDKGLAQSRLWPAGTLCITIAANIAKTGILDFDACFPDSVVGFQARNPAIITYVQCWMSFLQHHIEQMAPESAQKNINLEILRGLSIPVPSETALQKFHVAILALRCTLSRSTQRRRRTAELKSSLRSVSFAS